MATYNTTSGFPDLVGSMVIENNQAVSYTSATKGEGDVHNVGGPTLRFNVSFENVSRTYNINATSNASGDRYDGTANDNGPALAQEPWSATASTAVPYEQSASGYDEDKAAEAATS